MLQVTSSDTATVSTDRDLRSLLDTIVQRIATLSEVVSYEGVVNVAVLKTVVTVGNVLLEKRAILLPAIHAIFRQQARVLLTAKQVPEPQEFTNLSSRWILSELIGTLQHHMVYSCKVRKYGTLVYRSNRDFVLLTKAMWKLRNADGERVKEQLADCTTKLATEQQHVSNINKLITHKLKHFWLKMLRHHMSMTTSTWTH